MYTLNWLIEKRVLFLKIDGVTNLLELESLSMEICAYLDAGEAPVHLIVDNSTCRFEMFNMVKLKDTFKHHLGRPEIGWIILYGISNAFLQFMVATLTQVFNKRYNVCASFEAALSLLYDVDRTLVGLPVTAPEFESAY